MFVSFISVLGIVGVVYFSVKPSRIMSFQNAGFLFLLALMASVSALFYKTFEALNHAQSVNHFVAAVMAVGMFGIARAWLIMRKETKSPEDVARAVTHAVGGMMAFNFQAFVMLVAASVGREVPAVVAQFMS